MRFEKSLLALVACMTVAAFGSNAAQASPGSKWTVGAEGTGPGTTLSSETVEVSGGPWTLSGSVLGARCSTGSNRQAGARSSKSS